MELPHLGEHCSLKSCNKLDYLPVTCALCKRIFCTQHGYSADSHSCPEKHLIVDVTVEVCEKCKQRIDGNESHICKKLKRTHQCTVAKCKSRIVMPLSCRECYQIVCPRHRFPSDHKCIGIRIDKINLVDVCG